MARFFFDVYRDGKKFTDREGSYCESIGLAYREAKRMVDGFAKERTGSKHSPCPSWIEVQYADRSTLFRIPIASAS